jgi:hypothetical protein
VTGMVVEETLSMWWEERTLCVVESTWSHGVGVSTDLDELQLVFAGPVYRTENTHRTELD